jgi:quercetin dioxygenase-like cupin family protein
MFVFNNDVVATDCEPGVSRKVLSYTEDLMMCEISFDEGSEGTVHSHIHQQITYVAEGSFEFTIDGETEVVGAGDSLYIPANAVHGVKALEAGILVDVFTPMRKDFV